ncbi:YwqG family protein [Leptolyngbya sp. AN03gr2]|uniref:YwqG family protein n=1 Tax=unclassified Leptolyngbya TaxID=2650499 RepID=UPI003D320109
MNCDRLITLIHEHGLSEHQDEILASARPAIFMRLEEAEPGKVGQSRIGGEPDLPASIPWLKEDSLEMYFRFLMQINLAELPDFPENPFPRQGMIYLFVDDYDDGADQLVVYTGTEPLQPTPLPSDREFCNDWCVDLVPHRLTFQLSPDIPRWWSQEYDALCEKLTAAGLSDDLSIDELARKLSNHAIGRLLGYVAGIGYDPRESKAQPQDWVNLLQVDSSTAVNLCIGDAGYLQVLIHREDLQRLDFSRILVNHESS